MHSEILLSPRETVPLQKARPMPPCPSRAGVCLSACAGARLVRVRWRTRLRYWKPRVRLWWCMFFDMALQASSKGTPCEPLVGIAQLPSSKVLTVNEPAPMI
jgi:hypothetical protein